MCLCFTHACLWDLYGNVIQRVTTTSSTSATSTQPTYPSIRLLPNEIRARLWSLASRGFRPTLMCSLLVNDRGDSRWQQPFRVMGNERVRERWGVREWENMDEKYSQEWYKAGHRERLIGALLLSRCEPPPLPPPLFSTSCPTPGISATASAFSWAFCGDERWALSFISSSIGDVLSAPLWQKRGRCSLYISH